ncbi:MAG: response regulator transcription factor [Mucilaginibacter polytrichastri]|nr:response regulator transcription factor [Mucilaginibacter polytrichastri]
MILNCIAVDDEPVALDLVSSYIEQTPYLKLARKCPSAISALSAIHEIRDIRLIFLDIRMAELSGMELAGILAGSYTEKKIRIIFTTAYSDYAIDGYKVGAIDYLLKPFSFVDFSKAVTRALAYFEDTSAQAPVATPAPQAVSAERKYIYLKVEYQLVKVDLDDILYIEGLKDYVKVYLKDVPRPILSLTSLKALEEKLPETAFLRMHRSYIVALDKIKAVTKSSVLVGDITIPITEQNRAVFSEFLKRWT